LGLDNYYRRFIKGCADITEPLNGLILKDKFLWVREQEKAFEEAKKRLVSEKVRRQRDLTKKFILYTDASDVALGAKLY
jgi:hypothetical protein